MFVGTSVVSALNGNQSTCPKAMHRGNWLYVGGGGSGNYTTIQSAIDNASSGDTIFVYKGIYYENLLLDSSKNNITFLGEDKEKTIIDGMNTSGVDTFFISSVHITISGFTIQNSSRYGLYILSCFGNDSLVKNNIFRDNHLCGLVIYDSDNDIVSGNAFFDNYWGLYLGSTKYSSCFNNVFSSNNESLYLSCYVFCTTIHNNIFTNSDLAVDVYGGCPSNLFYHNDFISNKRNANDDSRNFWDNGSQGNYWSNYMGQDNNSDGIGDTPYLIPDNGNQDNYPLMHPFENYISINISLSNSIVPEMSEFIVTVKSLLNKPVQGAIVKFNNQTEQTDAMGRIYLVAPKVEADTTFEITASKEGFKNTSCLISVRNNPAKLSIIYGKITNLSTVGDYISFNAVKTRIMTFHPMNFYTYISGEKMFIDKNYKGFINVGFLFIIEKG